MVGRFIASTLLLAMAVPASAAQIKVGRNVQISKAHSQDNHYEVLAAADLHDSKRLIVGSITYVSNSTAFGTRVYSSSDGGRHWRTTLGDPLLEDTGDPAVAFDTDGSAYYTCSHLPAISVSSGDRSLRKLFFFRSRDGGQHWDPAQSLTYIDREYIAIDMTGGKYSGRIYLNGYNRIPYNITDLVVYRTSDQGHSFQGPGVRDGFGKFNVPTMGNSIVTSDGTFVGIFGQVDQEKESLYAITSVDGGESLLPPVQVSQYMAGGHRKTAMANVNYQPIMAIDAGNGPYKDRLYLTWTDRRSGHSQIFFASSSDQGKTWSPGRAVNDNPPDDLTDQTTSTVAVNRNGVIGLLWYDRRNHSDDLGWDVRFTASLDGGASFLPSVRVSTEGTNFGPTTPWSGLVAPVSHSRSGELTLQVMLNSFMFLGGDTAGLASDAGGAFHPVWIDNRTGISQVWTAAVTVDSRKNPAPGIASRPGSPGKLNVEAEPKPSSSSDLMDSGPISADPREQDPDSRHDNDTVAGQGDLSARLSLEVLRTNYDRKQNVLTVVGQLANISKELLSGPFRLHAVELTSQLANEIEVLNPSPGSKEGKAEWLFGTDKLPAGTKTAPLTLRFKLSGIKPYRDGAGLRYGLLSLKATVLRAQ